MPAARHNHRKALLLSGVLLLGGCKTELYSAVPEQDANEMIALLTQRDIAADKIMAKDGSDTVVVEKSHFADAVTILHDAGFPRKTFENMGDIFKSGGLVASPMQERARFLYALGQELSGTISQIDGVLSARVAVVLPENDILDRSPTPSAASVFVRYDSASNVDHLVPQIKMLVANSVQGLTYDKVSVVLVPALRPVLPPIRSASYDTVFTSLLAAFLGAACAAGIGVAGLVFRERLKSVIEMSRHVARWRRRTAKPAAVEVLAGPA